MCCVCGPIFSLRFIRAPRRWSSARWQRSIERTDSREASRTSSRRTSSRARVVSTSSCSIPVDLIGTFSPVTPEPERSCDCGGVEMISAASQPIKPLLMNSYTMFEVTVVSVSVPLRVISISSLSPTISAASRFAFAASSSAFAASSSAFAFAASCFAASAWRLASSAFAAFAAAASCLMNFSVCTFTGSSALPSCVNMLTSFTFERISFPRVSSRSLARETSMATARSSCNSAKRTDRPSHAPIFCKFQHVDSMG